MKITDTEITALEGRGFKRWQKNCMDRLYVNATRIGLELEFYNSGNISGAWLNGERISNCRARGLRECKTYIDVVSGSVHSGSDELRENAQKILDEIRAA